MFNTVESNVVSIRKLFSQHFDTTMIRNRVYNTPQDGWHSDAHTAAGRTPPRT
jgi:hypothetical protein